MDEQLGVYEMLWDCRFCGTKKNLGKTHRHCPSCGSAQDPTWRYFPSDTEKVAVKDHVFVGADKVCAYCGNPASAAAKHCGSCGAGMEDAKGAKTRKSQEQADGAAFAAETAADAKREREEERAKAKGPQAKAAPKGGSRWWLWLGLVAAAIVALVIIFTRKKEAAVVVTGHSWEREVKIEDYGPRKDSEWCDHMPAGAYRVTRTQEKRSEKEVPDGQECKNRRVDNGDGTFRMERECKPKYKKQPVLDDKCHFMIDKWAVARSVKANGTGLRPEPHWPEATVTRGGTCVGCERLGKREESYFLELEQAGDRKASRCTVDEAKWRSVPSGSRWIIDVRSVTGSADCSSMRPAK